MRSNLFWKRFAEHPAAVGETYLQHMAAAVSFGSDMLIAGIACIAHGVFPFLFVHTGSNAVRRLHQRMIEQRGGRRAPRDLVSAE